jgi:Ca-activated chloride channel family protein
LPKDIDPPPDILVNAIYSRPILPAIDSHQLVYVLLDLMALPVDLNGGAPKHPILNLGLVLDTSTSMKGPRLESVKSMAIELIRQLKPGDVISVVTFNDRAEVIVPAKRGLEKLKLEASIRRLTASGGTEISQGLRAGFQEVYRHVSPSHVSHIVLITDGRTYGDEEASLNLAQEAVDHKISISSMGIGSSWNDELLDQIAVITGGSSLHAAYVQDIKQIMEENFNHFSRTFANNVTMEFSTKLNVELRYAFRLSPESGTLLCESPIKLGHIPLSSNLSVIMEFMVHDIPPETKNLHLLEGAIKLDIPTRSIPNSTSRITFMRPVSMNPKTKPPPQVLVNALSKLSMYRMQELARNDLLDGNKEKAARRLNNLATQLLSAGEPGLAQTIMLQIQQIENTGSISEDAEKRIKYGTRSLLLPSGMEATPK